MRRAFSAYPSCHFLFLGLKPQAGMRCAFGADRPQIFTKVGSLVQMKPSLRWDVTQATNLHHAPRPSFLISPFCLLPSSYAAARLTSGDHGLWPVEPPRDATWKTNVLPTVMPAKESFALLTRGCTFHTRGVTFSEYCTT